MKTYTIIEPKTQIKIECNERKFVALFNRWYNRIDVLQEKQTAKKQGQPLYNIVFKGRCSQRFAVACFPVIK